MPVAIGVLAAVTASAGFYTVFAITRGTLIGEAGLSILVYALIFLIVALLAFSVSLSRLRRSGSDRPVFAATAIALLTLAVVVPLVAARPDGPPMLSELVDDACRPRTTVIPHALASPSHFWISVSFAAENAIERAASPAEVCTGETDPVLREGCVDWLRQSDASIRYCLRHADRQREMAR